MSEIEGKSEDGSGGLRCNEGLGVALANAVKDWWEKHKYDTSGSWNVYDQDPPFVVIAKNIIGNWEHDDENESA